MRMREWQVPWMAPYFAAVVSHSWGEATCDLPVLELAGVNASVAVREFSAVFRGRSPVLLKGLFGRSTWRQLLRRWAKPRILAKYGHLAVRPHDLHRGCARAGVPFNITSVRGILRETGGRCYFLQSHHALPQALKNDFRTPPAIQGVQLSGPSLSIGGAGAVAGLHSHEENWLAQVFGRKLWLVGLEFPELPDPVFSQLCEPGLKLSTCCNRFARTVEKVASLAGARLRRCIAGPSDVLYLPDNWAHATCQLGAYNVAIGFFGDVSQLPPLHRAAVTGDSKTASMALAQTSKRLHLGLGTSLSPWELAAWSGHISILNLLSTFHGMAGGHALHWACSRGHVAAATWLLARTADPARAARTTNGDGVQAMHWAAAAGHAAVLKVLIGHRAEPDAADGNGASASHWLAGEGHLHVLLYLLGLRADGHASDHDGMSIAHTAAHFGHVPLLKALALSNVNLQSPTHSHGLRPLNLAVAAGHGHVRDFLRGMS